MCSRLRLTAEEIPNMKPSYLQRCIFDRKLHSEDESCTLIEKIAKADKYKLAFHFFAVKPIDSEHPGCAQGQLSPGAKSIDGYLLRGLQRPSKASTGVHVLSLSCRPWFGAWREFAHPICSFSRLQPLWSFSVIEKN